MSSHRMTLRSKARRTAPPPPTPQPEEESESESEESEDEPSITVTAAPARSQRQRQPAAAPPPKPAPRKPERRPVYLDNAEYPVETYASTMYEYRNNARVLHPPPNPGPFVVPRPPVPTAEHSRASLLRGRLYSAVVDPDEPRDLDKQLVLAQTIQTWRGRVLHAPPADPSTNPERQQTISQRLELMKAGPAGGRWLRDNLKLGDRSLMAERSEWLDWRLIAGSQYWVCPRCNEHVLTSDIPAHRTAHGIIPVINTNTD
ncbi:hypothetical protein AURDEDRAFT_148495 [Auricularia subglabra TFB-10046 SS5]|nr:hypothetical protein AURDEDRAFT_148495 [Auricularia subglabra TFB-10046 SS5]